MAYESESKIRQRYPKTVRVASPGSSEVQYFLEIDRDTKTQFVSIRGSADSANFTEDLEISVRTDRRSKIPIHRGFDEVAQIVYADLKPYLQPGYRTHLTGHSLGAAVAAIVMLYMYEDGVRVTRMIGFGQPRFTTAKGVDAYRKLPITRVVDANDMVPLLPPSTVLDPAHGPYQQVGPEIILLDNQRYVYLDFHDANRISIGEFWRSTSFSDLKDHSMDRYLVRISAKFDGAEPVTYAARQRYVAKKPDPAVIVAQPN
jgi:triacylglycerol lipase